MPSTIAPKKGADLYILFIIWPFLAFLMALKNFQQKNSRVIVLLFLVLYGFTYIVFDPAMDGYRRAEYFAGFAAQPFSEFFNVFGSFIAFGDRLDIVEPFLQFLVSRFTIDYRYVFAVYALVFGFFYLKSIHMLHSRFREHKNINAQFILLLFIFILPIFHINGFRMWTATWVFFYGAYHVVLYRDRKYFLLSLFSVLIHFSFWAPNAILFIYFFLGNRNNIYFPLMVASFILVEFPMVQAFLFNVGEYLGGGFQAEIEAYASDHSHERVVAGQETRRWFQAIPFLFYFLLLAVAVARYGWRNHTRTPDLENLYSFILLFLSFSNFFSPVLAGGRFRTVFYLFAATYVFISFIKIRARKIHWLTITGLFPVALTILLSIRIFGNTINAWIFSPSISLIVGPPVSFYEFLRSIL